MPSADPCYVAPECYDNTYVPENDIFSFGLILYEVIVGKPVFSRDMDFEEIAGALVLRQYRPEIPKWVLPKTAELICDCLAENYCERPSFNEILDRLEEMRFKLIPMVNSSKVAAFVKGMKDWEAQNCPQ
jgi:serine/threonine protein kinase